jgi:molybdenum cofactor synthesis domain-containing protein
MYRIEVLVVGREILTGRTLEADANWIAKRVAALGARLSRITVVDDNIAEIAARIGDAASGGADLLITTGGLGPTFDDVTAAGVARALDVPLQLHQDARAFIEHQYFELFDNGLIQSADLTPEREKMALIPRGADWIENPVGTAPGVVANLGDMQIVCLPGVPRELYAMFDLALGLKLARQFDEAGFAEITLPTDQNDESVLSPLTAAITARHPGLHIKTNPTYFGDSDGIGITFSAYASSADAAGDIVKTAMAEMEDALREKQADDD